jgi:hypothetical protein
MDGLVDARQDREVEHTSDLTAWRLAPGVGLLSGTLVGDSGEPARNACLVVLPNGRRFEVTPSLFLVAELLAGDVSLRDVARQIGQRTGRLVSPSALDAIVRQKLVPAGVVQARDAPAMDGR